MPHPVLIAGQWRAASSADSSTRTFFAENPATGDRLDAEYPVSAWADCDAALSAAVQAAAVLRQTPPEQIARFLTRFAERIESIAQQLAETANQETALPVAPRLKDIELPRTTGQFRQAAVAALDGSWALPTIDSKLNIRSHHAGIGPVLVMGPNNFPMAFNGVSGGDFAAAVASGNPVIAKAHPSHPSTTRLLAEQAFAAITDAGLSPATLQLIYHIANEDGLRMAADPRLGAIAFTGSRTAGLKLKAAADAVGKPVYLEMSSLNPVIILPGALRERASKIADELADSCLAASGQFCTKPGLVAFTELRADGSTRCGCWVYCGVYADEVNQAARRKPGQDQSWVAPEWGWAWPANRRILYNRASADPAGKPWSERKAYVWWDAEQGRWVGHDVPDFEVTKPPGFVPEPGAQAEDALGGAEPFIMQSDGRAWLYAPAGLVDGPLPTHYEPEESPLRNALYGQQANPARQRYVRPENPYNPTAGERGAEVFPYVFTTFRIAEHHTAGGMSRWSPYLAELAPEMFLEVSPALAAERGLTHGSWAHVVTSRSAIEGRVLVTERMRPLRAGGATIHQIGIPWHWGPNGLTTGDAANELLGVALDPNVHIMETKAATCDIRPGRRPRGPALPELVAQYRQRAGIEP